MRSLHQCLNFSPLAVTEDSQKPLERERVCLSSHFLPGCSPSWRGNQDDRNLRGDSRAESDGGGHVCCCCASCLHVSQVRIPCVGNAPTRNEHGSSHIIQCHQGNPSQIFQWPASFILDNPHRCSSKPASWVWS